MFACNFHTNSTGIHHQTHDLLLTKCSRLLGHRENVFIWKNISSARRDPGRIQARSRLAGEMFSHVNACEILYGKAM